jgi:hypothetical protein
MEPDLRLSQFELALVILVIDGLAILDLDGIFDLDVGTGWNDYHLLRGGSSGHLFILLPDIGHRPSH